MPGSTSWHIRSRPKTLVSNWRRTSSRASVSVRRSAVAGVVHERANRAPASSTAATAALIDSSAVTSSASVLPAASRVLEHLRLARAGVDAVAALGEVRGGGAPDAGGAAGDEDRLRDLGHCGSLSVAWPHEQRLRGAPVRPRSSQSAVSARPSGPSSVSASRQTHSPSGGRSEVDAWVGVDEEVLAPVERRAHAVARIGRDQHAGCRGLLPLHQRRAHAHPDRRGARLEEASAHKAVLHAGVVARPGRGEEGPFLALPRARRRAAARARRPTGRRRAARRAPAAARRRGLRVASSSSTLRPGRTTRALSSSGASGTRRRGLDGDAPDRKAGTGLAALERTADQRRRRAGVLRLGIHGPRVSSEGRRSPPSCA